MKIHQIIRSLTAVACLAAWPVMAKAQSLFAPGDSAGTGATSIPAPASLAYTRPTQTTKLHNYFIDAFGPYPILGAAVKGGFDQATKSPPEWGEGTGAYSKRFASNFAMAAVGTSTRYALAEVFKEDTLYYRCECKGVLPRLGHAVISTVTARRGEDGHRAFSFSSLVAPYAGAMVGVYGWYPGRYSAKDGFRMGNYTLLQYVGANIALEFLTGGPHSLLKRIHLNNTHGAPDSRVEASLNK